MSAQIPEAEHKLKGTRATRTADNGADIAPGRPKFPKSLSMEARAVFKLLVRQLQERRACTAGDMQILHLYSELHLRWVKARAQVEALGEVVTDTRLDSNGGAHEVLRKNPWLTVAETAETKMHAILRDLGLTPNARAKVKQVGNKPKDVDPMDEFLKAKTLPHPGTSSMLEDLDDFEVGEIQ